MTKKASTEIEELKLRIEELETIISKAYPWIGVRPPTSLPRDYRDAMKAAGEIYYRRRSA